MDPSPFFAPFFRFPPAPGRLSIPDRRRCRRQDRNGVSIVGTFGTLLRDLGFVMAIFGVSLASFGGSLEAVMCAEIAIERAWRGFLSLRDPAALTGRTGPPDRSRCDRQGCRGRASRAVRSQAEPGNEENGAL